MCRFDSNSKGTCANFLLTGKVQFVGQEGVWYNHFLSQIMQIISLGWPFTKETVKNFISCVPSAQGQSLPNCMYWVQSTLWLPCLYFGKDPLLFFVALVKVQLVVCIYCYHPYVCLACISKTSLCFFVVSNQGAVCCVYPLQSTPGPPCRVSIFNLLSLNCTAYCKEHNRTHRTTLQRTHRATLQRTHRTTLQRTHQKTKRSTTQRTPLPTAAPPWCHRSIMPNVRVGLFQLLDAGPRLAMAPAGT